MRKLAAIPIVILLIFPTARLLAQTLVRAWEEPLVIPTYQVGKPDPNPIFYTERRYQGAKGPIYPYGLMDLLTDIRADKSYQAVYLENRYLRLSVLPEIGGRIFSAIDKTNNYDFFYRQHVIKPALIGMLGAWISGGVEWNIPHHHRATSFMPVDTTIEEHTDGSKTVWVGEIELRHRMKWIIGLTLYPDKSYVEATVKLFNRTPLPHSILYWANPAVYANPDYQVIFPPDTELVTYHAKNQFAHWPISTETFNTIDYTKGVDISWWKNHPSPISLFALDSKADFHAGYDHGKKAGVVHVANHHIVPGKKFWEWGNGPPGRMWDKMLTETDGPYIELMVGGYSDNQPDYSWCQPYEAKLLKQYWYPIREIGGVKNATREAAVNLEVNGANRAKIGFNATAEYPDARALIESGGKTLFEQRINISPEKAFVAEVPLPQNVKGDSLKVSLRSSSGKELVTYASIQTKEEPMPEPYKLPPAPKEIKTVEELYLAGLRLEQFYNPEREPYPYYEEALIRDPGDYRVNTALGILYCKRGMYKEATERLEAAVKRATQNHTRPKDGEALYYLGVALRAQGKEEAAFDAFYKATWSLAWHSAAYYALAELSARKGDLAEALNAVDRSIATNAWNTKALNLKAAVLRKLERFEEAQDLAARALQMDPLDFWGGNELYLAKLARGPRDDAMRDLDALNRKMRGASHSYLELALDYSNSGFADEAMEVLARRLDSTDRAGLDPITAYHLAHLCEIKGKKDQATRYYRIAREMSAAYCFPYTLETIDVLRHAAAVNPKDARAPYYLGNLLYDLQPREAVEQWERARTLDDSFPTAHRNLAFAHAQFENNIPKAVSSMEAAFARDPRDPRYLLELDRLYEAAGVAPKKRLEALEKNHEVALKRDDTLARQIVLHVRLGQYDRALELLNRHHFHIWEGGSGVRSTYVEAHLLRGRQNFAAKRYKDALKDYQAATEYPENLEVARGYGEESPQVDYLLGTAHGALGDSEKARASFERSAAAKRRGSEADYYRGLSLRKLGREGEAIQMFDGLISAGKRRLSSPGDPSQAATFERRESRRKAVADAHYIAGLGHLGKGNAAEGWTEFKKALEIDICHLGAATQLAAMAPPKLHP